MKFTSEGQEVVEITIIFFPDTILKVEAMMIIIFDAITACRAVMDIFILKITLRYLDDKTDNTQSQLLWVQEKKKAFIELQKLALLVSQSRILDEKLVG